MFVGIFIRIINYIISMRTVIFIKSKHHRRYRDGSIFKCLLLCLPGVFPGFLHIGFECHLLTLFLSIFVYFSALIGITLCPVAFIRNWC